MNKNVLIAILILCAAIICTSCDKENEEPITVGIEGISFENYPRVNGSTSTDPLNCLIAAKLLGLEYTWAGGVMSFAEYSYELMEKLQTSQTHGAIINLIDNQTDLIIVARKMSTSEKQYADNAGVSLIETPIALDALDFIVHAENPVNSLSVEQIQQIYLGNIINWSDVGGENEEIIPFIRNKNSGSQEMMNELVMDHAGMPNWGVSLTDEIVIWSMASVYLEISVHRNGICFTPHYYKEYMVPESYTRDVETLAVNGIKADKNSIKNKTYPFVANVYVSIRSDTDTNSMTYKLYEWLQSEAGKNVIAESGYVPN